MMEFFRKILEVPEDKFKIMVRISNKGNAEKAKTYWSKITKFSRRNFREPEMLKLTSNSKSLKKYPYGMGRVCIYDTLLFRKMIALIKEFSKRFEGLPL